MDTDYILAITRRPTERVMLVAFNDVN